MIGLHRPTVQSDNTDEPLAIKGKTKKQLHMMLSEEYCLPTIDSKGVNRYYLVGVYLGKHFRVQQMEMKRFEIELTPQQQKRTNLVNLT